MDRGEDGAALTKFVPTGSYGVPEAAKLASVNQHTARGWITPSKDGRRRQLLLPDLSQVDGRYALSFLDLIDLVVVGRFREKGVSMQTIRRVYHKLAKDLDTRHPFSHRQLFTDGRTIFMGTVDDVDDPKLIEVLTQQHAMPEVLMPFLKQIDYGPETDTAIRWRIADGVVLDPTRSFGKPLIAEEGTTTFVLARAYYANGQDAELVADLFDVSPRAVRQAVAFERALTEGRAA